MNQKQNQKNENPESAHRQRPRYKGRYPRKFEEKYKEHHPEKYKDTIEKVISKGSTPAGMHLPIMVEEILDVLQIRPGMVGLDCTLGYGGHSAKMAACLAGQGHLYALDADPIELAKTRVRMEEKGFGQNIFTAIHTNFRNIDQIAQEHGPFDFILADLGVSSMQIDNPERGFSYKTDGPLDLRFNPEKGESAADRLSRLSRDEIASMLYENSDEPYAEKLAQSIDMVHKKGQVIATTTQLRRIIEDTVSRLPKKALQEQSREDAVKKTCARTFQALRIDVNSEMEVLYEFLDKLPHALKENGRAAILTFHSGEDRLVKKAFSRGYKGDIYSDISRNVIRPTPQECHRNPRARSTKLRWAVRSS